ncbi:hypothetical protein FNV43_RR07247 [Rhamnella rubrinervis]|uniref:Uncharacterized protein n=1 Tax=Rhamnella rubrinervis TaxID=2594499 RepID=A0A8K0HEF7_9ROSA|nr:hypothetical protein FNV43_RR07247 [Rhamnella rubrinervis]
MEAVEVSERKSTEKRIILAIKDVGILQGLELVASNQAFSLVLAETNSSFLVNIYPYNVYRLQSEIQIGYTLFQAPIFKDLAMATLDSASPWFPSASMVKKSVIEVALDGKGGARKAMVSTSSTPFDGSGYRLFGVKPLSTIVWVVVKLLMGMRKEMLDDEASLFTGLPISAESAKMLPDRKVKV